MNGEGVFKVRAAKPYHKFFEVATTPTRKFIAHLSHSCFLPSKGKQRISYLCDLFL